MCVAVIALEAGLEAVLAATLPRDLLPLLTFVAGYGRYAALLGLLAALHERRSGRWLSLPRVLARGAVRSVEGTFTLTLYGAAVLVGLLLFVLPGVWLMTRWAFVLHVIAIEGRGVDRAWELTAGRPLGRIALVQWTSWGLAWAAAIPVLAVLGSSGAPDGSPVLVALVTVTTAIPSLCCAFTLYETYRRLASA